MVQVLGRRWAVALPVLLLGFGAAAWAAFAIPDEYTLDSTMMVVERDQAATLVTPAIMAQAAMGGAVRDEVRELTKVEANYEVRAEREGILEVTATGSTPENAVLVANTVLEKLGPELQKRQTQVEGGQASGSVDIVGRASTNGVVANTDTRRVTTYQARGSARMIGAGTDAGVKAGHAMRVVRIKLGSEEYREQVKERGGSPVYEIVIPRNGATMNVSISATTPEKAILTAEVLTALGEPALKDVLENVYGSTQNNLAVQQVGGGTSPVKNSKGMLRSVVALVAVTFGLALAVAFVAESLAEYRASKTAGATAAAGSPVAPATGATPVTPVRPNMPTSSPVRPSGAGRPAKPVVPVRSARPTQSANEPASTNGKSSRNSSTRNGKQRPQVSKNKASMLPKPSGGRK